MIEILLRLFQAFEAEALQWSFLGMTDAGLYLAFSIGITDATRQGTAP